MKILQIVHLRRSHCTLGNKKSHFQLYYSYMYTSDYIHYLTRKQSVVHLPTPPENVTTLTCELQNFSSDWRFVAFFSDVGSAETSQLWVVVGGSEKNRLWCVATGMSGSSVIAGVQNDHILHYTCFQSFSTLISRIVHHAVLKFSPCRNKPLPQASTCPYQYACSSCSVPQTQY